MRLLLVATAFAALGSPICHPAGARTVQLDSEQDSVSSVRTWRAAFREAGTRDGLAAFVAVMRNTTEDARPGPVGDAFLATAEVMRAGSRRNPIAKLIGFRKWTAALDRASASRPGHPDIALLRLTVQARAPGFLGYDDDMATDCGTIADAMRATYWAEDPDHRVFVDRILAELEVCP